VTTEELQELSKALIREWHGRELRVPSRTHHSVYLASYAKQHKTSKEDMLKALESLRDAKQITLSGGSDDWMVTLAE
jgi:hypothetical protein